MTDRQEPESTCGGAECREVDEHGNLVCSCPQDVTDMKVDGETYWRLRCELAEAQRDALRDGITDSGVHFSGAQQMVLEAVQRERDELRAVLIELLDGIKGVEIKSGRFVRFAAAELKAKQVLEAVEEKQWAAHDESLRTYDAHKETSDD